MNSYYEKLKDPKWQKKRLEIFDRDKFTCQNCGSTIKTLSVHHWLYSLKPWEVEDKYLLTVCEDCHKLITKFNEELKLAIADIFCGESKGPFNELKFELLITTAMAISQKDNKRLINLFFEQEQNDSFNNGFAEGNSI